MRQNGGYADSEGGGVRASWSILMRVFCGRTPDSIILVPACGTTFVAVLPIAAATASLSATVTVFLCLYPFCHLFFRWRYLH